MLFRVNKDNQIIIHTQAIKLCPLLRKVSKEDLAYIVMAYDYRSPFHQLPTEDRYRRASDRAYGTIDKVEEANTKLSRHIEEYMSLQYDERRETLRSYQDKLKLLRMHLQNETSSREMKNLDETIMRFMERCEEIQKIIDQDDNIQQLIGGGNATFLERWQKNMRKYKEEQAQKAKNILA